MSKKRFHPLLAMLGLLLLPAAASPPDPTEAPATRPNVLLVTIDTLRADHLGSYGDRLAHTPVLDELARHGVRFADATAHVPLTLPAHVAILTGRYPSRYGVRLNGMTVLPDTVPTLAASFKAAGYLTAAFVASAILDKSYGLARGFDVYDDDFKTSGSGDIALSELQRPASEVESLAARWLERAPPSPWFVWVHFFDPHLPYTPPAKYLALAKGRPYDGEIACTDASLGALLGKIDRASTVVVVTGDHGESLGDHGEEDHGYFIYDSTLSVPLIIDAPGFVSRVVKEQVRSIDIAPTVEELAGFPVGEHDGESLVPLMRGEARREVPPSYAESWYPRLHFGWSELRAVRVGEWKYIAAPRSELYDLRADPRERSSVIGTKAPVAGRLAQELSTLGARLQAASAATAPPAQPDPETVRRLQALGYVGGFAPTASTSGGADPKDRIQEYQQYRRLFNQALGALDRGDPVRAVTLFKRLLATNVRAFEAHLYLGNAYATQRKFDAALGEYEAARQLNPGWPMVDFEAAKVLSATGDVAGAIERCRRGLALEPLSFYGHYTLGVIHQKAGQQPEALEELSKAVALNGNDPRARGNLAQAAMKLGRLDLAREQSEKMIELGYRVAPAHYNLGVIAARLGNQTEAARHYRDALAADPAFQPAREALSKIGK